MVDTPDSKSGAAMRAGSNPALGTNNLISLTSGAMAARSTVNRMVEGSNPSWSATKYFEEDQYIFASKTHKNIFYWLYQMPSSSVKIDYCYQNNCLQL